MNEEINGIETVYSGNISANEIQGALKQNLELSQKHGVTRLLADCTHLKPGRSVLNTYEFATQLESIPGIYQLKEAMILPIMQEAAEEIRFFETAARNRGLNVRVFSSREEAIKWLIE
ncbi:MAG: hypothetical protein HGB11_15805 [Chlorobiales bacterium]|nr:hypothetical protein [Chlorobiales bacterium]